MALNHDETIYIKLKYKIFSNFSITDEEVKCLVEGRMKEYLNKYKNLDPLDLYFLNKVYNSDLNYEQLKFHIVIEKN